jgi:hypothetical protein
MNAGKYTSRGFRHVKKRVDYFLKSYSGNHLLKRMSIDKKSYILKKKTF